MDQTIPNFGINESILKDKHTIVPFINAIQRNAHLFKGKRVLEINSGTGVLSVLAVRAGAKHVYTMNGNAFTKEICRTNCGDKITVFEGSIKDNKLDVKVDIIISLWFGSLLFYDSSIEDIIYARDTYLAQDGIIFPDKGYLYIQTIEDTEYMNKKVNFWDQPYDVSMKCIKPWVKKEPLLESIDVNQLNGDPYCIYEVDLLVCQVADLSFANTYNVKVNRNDFVTGVVIWMEVIFSKCHIPISINMSPGKNKYIKPAIFYFEEEFPVFKQERVKGSVAMKYGKDEMDIKISCHAANKVMTKDQVQYYRVN